LPRYEQKSNRVSAATPEPGSRSPGEESTAFEFVLRSDLPAITAHRAAQQEPYGK